MDYIHKEISPGIEFLCVPADRFKTNEIAVSFAVPLDENVSANALLTDLLSRKSREYPDMTALNKKLAMLYGAYIEASVSKVGENQLLKLGITCLDDRFSLDGGSISYECVKLLLSLVFDPKLNENGLFFEKDVESEKRVLTEKIDSEENEKRTYVLRKAEELMFGGEPYAINKYGTRQQVQALSADKVTQAWKTLLRTAKIMITVVGTADTEKLCSLAEEKLAGVKRAFKPLEKAVFVPECKNIKEYTERIDVKQGKLVLGFRVNLEPDSELTPAMRSFCDIFGGGPYSKLFANVREKMSLCYYCSARYTRLKSCIFVQSGCNEENMDKAVGEILNQLEEIKKGNFDEELVSSKLALRDAVMSVNDAPELIESWYINQIADGKIKTPKQSAQENDSVTREQIISCAKLLTLDTVYKLTAVKEAQ